MDPAAPPLRGFLVEESLQAGCARKGASCFFQPRFTSGVDYAPVRTVKVELWVRYPNQIAAIVRTPRIFFKRPCRLA